MTMGRDFATMGKGMAAGLVATLALSLLMLVLRWLEVGPAGLDVIGALTMIAGTPDARWVGWLGHFLIGTVVWGSLFTWLLPLLPGSRPGVKGLWFGALAWLLMMITILPMVGMGSFGVRAGLRVPMTALILHLAYGWALGAAYGALMGRQRAGASPVDMA